MNDEGQRALALFFESYYRLRPVNATFTGVHEYDHVLPDWSPEGLEAAADELRRLRATIGSVPPDSLSPYPDRIDLRLADAFLEIQLAELTGSHFQRRNPSLFAGEAVFGVLSLVTRDFAPFAVRLAAVTARLRAVPAFLAHARSTLAGDLPAEWTARAVRECEGATIFLARGFDLWLAHWCASADDSRPLTSSAIEDARAAAAAAQAALHEFAAWLEKVHPGPSSKRYGCGAALFDLLLSRGHFCRQSAPELLREARDAFDAAVARLDRMAREGAEGWAEIQERLAAEHPAVTGYLAAYRQVWDACRRVAEARDLVTWPDSPIRYVPIPTWTRDAAPCLYYLSYRSPAPFDRLPVADYEVPPIDGTLPVEQQERLLRLTNDSVIKLNHIVHHGAIGHHVQNYYAYRSASRIGQVAAVDCASRIGMFCGGTLAEGWACYATDLMDEAGFLSPLERVAEQHSRVRQIARAVVDIELHRGSMDLEQAVAFYRERVGMTAAAARGEACRNSMFPGTAIMYWLGTEGIHRLRAEREQAEGESFSLKRFHDRLLSFGAIPVPLIAEMY